MLLITLLSVIELWKQSQIPIIILPSDIKLCWFIQVVREISPSVLKQWMTPILVQTH